MFKFSWASRHHITPFQMSWCCHCGENSHSACWQISDNAQNHAHITPANWAATFQIFAQQARQTKYDNLLAWSAHISDSRRWINNVIKSSCQFHFHAIEMLAATTWLQPASTTNGRNDSYDQNDMLNVDHTACIFELKCHVARCTLFARSYKQNFQLQTMSKHSQVFFYDLSHCQ